VVDGGVVNEAALNEAVVEGVIEAVVVAGLFYELMMLPLSRLMRL